MDYDFSIALYTTMLDTSQLRLGHLWHSARSSQAPDWFGQPWPALDSVIREQSIVHRVGTHEFSIASDKRKKKSTGILTSVLRSFGVTDFQMFALTQRSFTARVQLVDYVRPAVSRAALTRMIGMPVPPVYEGGHWFACYAQHQATSGSLELAYDRSDGYDLAAEIGAPASAGLAEPRTGLGAATLDVAQPAPGTGNRERGTGDDGGATPDVAQPERVVVSGDSPERTAHADSSSPSAHPPSLIPHPTQPAGRLQLANESQGVQLFSFHAEQPLVFGVSLQHLWEKDGKFSLFGDKHRDVDYAGS